MQDDKIHIFIDTSTLEDLDWNLGSNPLGKILGADEIHLHTTSITLFEVKTRMDALLVQARSTFKKMSRREKLVDWKDPFLALDAYRESCNHRHDGAGADLGVLVRLFLDCSPPFSKTKREEFKDAIAALSLHHWATQNNKIIYIISNDKDWKTACSTFPQFRRAKLGEIATMLYQIDSDRRHIDTEKIAQLIETSERHLLRALDSTPPQCNRDRIQAACESTSLRILVQKARTIDNRLSARASFSGSISAEFIDDHGNVWGTPSSQVNGTLNAILDIDYTLLEVDVIEWNVDLAQDPARQESFLTNFQVEDQS